jgi:hypothetical protein
MPDTSQSRDHDDLPLPSVLADLHKDKPPLILYHYTDQRGLLGIIKSKHIRATQVQHLSDRHELRHAFRLAKENIEARLTDTDDRDVLSTDDRDALNRLKETLRQIKHNMQVGIASFSCNGDLLSQWRAYGGSTGGFAIGFSGPGLKQAATGDVMLIRCIYNPDKQKRIVSSLIDDSVARAKAGKATGKTTTHTIVGDSIRWAQYAPALKNEAFTAEDEWRLVTGQIQTIDKRLGFRKGRTMIAPYLKIDIAAVEIRQVFIGPTVRQKESRRAVKKLFPNTIDVELSKVPYRNW